MRLILLSIITLTLTFLQHPEEYPPGWFCSPSGIIKDGVPTTDHPCHCERMIHSDDCEGIPTESPTCNQYCSKQHCACPAICAMPVPSEDPDSVE